MTMRIKCQKCGKYIIISRNNFSGEWSDKFIDKCECSHYVHLGNKENKK